VASLLLGFCEWDVISPITWVGLKNYGRLVNDPLFWQSLKVTGIYSLIDVPLGLFVGVVIALLMNQRIPGLSFFRTIYYLPSVVTGVAVSLLWIWIYNADHGLLNYFLGLIGIQGPQWLQNPRLVIPSLIGVSLWQAGGNMIIYLAGLQGIPTQLYEAARIDGARRGQVLFRITLPMLTPVIFYNLVVGIIKSLQTFTEVYVMTGGGPNNASLFYMLYLYRNAFKWFKMGYASALAWILFVIVLVCTVFLLRSSRSWVYYEADSKGG
jgi:multiple sugar transport system permease protein